jgi:hypothetical protein
VWFKLRHCEDSQGNVTADEKHVLKIWENYITDLANRPENTEDATEEKLMQQRKALILRTVK